MADTGRSSSGGGKRRNTPGGSSPSRSSPSRSSSRGRPPGKRRSSTGYSKKDSSKGSRSSGGNRGDNKNRGGGQYQKGGYRRTSNKSNEKIESTQIEGRRAVLELLIAGTRRTKEIFLADDLKPASILDDIKTIALSENVPVTEVPKARLHQIAHTDSPQGVVARAAPLKPKSLEDLAGIDKPFLLIIDGVVDTINLGGLLRNAECAGITGVVLGKHRSAQITPAAAKAAAGAIEYIPIALVSSIPTTIEKLKELKIWTVGLDSTASQQIYDIDVTNEPLALVIGAEGRGLSQLTTKRVDFLASIPLNGRISALNASSAVAIASFEIQRRRS